VASWPSIGFATSRQSYLVKVSARGTRRTAPWPPREAKGSGWENLIYTFRFKNEAVGKLTLVLEINVARNTPTPWNTPTSSGLRIRPLEHSHVCLKYTLQEIHLHLEIHPHLQVLKNKAVRKLTRVLETHVARNTPTPWNTPTSSGLRIRPLDISHVCLKYTLQEIHLHLEIHPHLQVYE